MFDSIIGPIRTGSIFPSALYFIVRKLSGAEAIKINAGNHGSKPMGESVRAIT
jgi:hypothetical protein